MILLLMMSAIEVRLAEHSDAIQAAAAIADVDPSLIEALLVHESEVRRWRVNPTSGCEGYGQIHWKWWGYLLKGYGLSREDLHHPIWGIMAVGLVLREIRERYHREGELALCFYGVGKEALKFKKDCMYSREVARLQEQMR